MFNKDIQVFFSVTNGILYSMITC